MDRYYNKLKGVQLEHSSSLVCRMANRRNKTEEIQFGIKLGSNLNLVITTMLLPIKYDYFINYFDFRVQRFIRHLGLKSVISVNHLLLSDLSGCLYMTNIGFVIIGFMKQEQITVLLTVVLNALFLAVVKEDAA